MSTDTEMTAEDTGVRHLKVAAEGVLRVVETSASDSTEMTELVTAVLQAVGNEVTETDPRLATPEGQRVIGLLRAAMLGWWEKAGTASDAVEFLAALAKLERLSGASTRVSDPEFTRRLAAPDGLDLVVEVAHDLRSPLTSILFLAETLQRGQSGDVNELQHRQLGLVYSAALGLSTVTSNVIELARGGNRLAVEEPFPFSVTEILESVHDIVRPMAEEKGLMIRLLPPVSDHKLGHPHALSRVLLNLTTNALKFTEEGFVEIVAKEPALNSVEFSVRDTGPGIRPETLNTLYQPFRRSHSEAGYAFSGTGLGLALSRKLVEAMGSELRVETRPGWGTRFYFELQMKPAGHD